MNQKRNILKVIIYKLYKIDTDKVKKNNGKCGKFNSFLAFLRKNCTKILWFMGTYTVVCEYLITFILNFQNVLEWEVCGTVN